MTIRDFYTSNIAPRFRRVDVDTNGYGNWRIAKGIAPTTGDRYKVYCWNGDVFTVDGFVEVKDWRS